MSIGLLELQNLRDSLIRARAKGVLEITDQNGESIRYSSADAMARAITDLEKRIEEIQNSGRPTTIRFNPSKFGDC